jgi:hypothetical protein
MTTFRAGRWLADPADSVTLGSARRFRMITVLLLYASIAIPMLLIRWGLEWPQSAYPVVGPFGLEFDPPAMPEIFANPWFFGACVAALLPALLTIVRVPAWFIHRRSLRRAAQCQATALGCYGVGPLALFAPLMALASFFAWFDRQSLIELPAHHDVCAWLFITAVTLCALLPIVWWGLTVRMILRVTRSVWRAMAAAVLLPLLWIALPALVITTILVLVNCVALFIATAH